MKRKLNTLSGRIREAEIVAGKLILRGAWSKWEKRDVTLSIFPEDVGMLEAALTQFKSGEVAFHTERETRQAKALAEAKVRAAKRKERKERNIPTFGGVRIIDLPDDKDEG